MSGAVAFRPMLAADAVQLALQPSQHVCLGVTRPVLSIEDGRELAEGGPAWTAIAGGRVVACAGFRLLWPPSGRTAGHAVAWALLAAGIGAAHLAVTRFARARIAESPLARIEAIARAEVEAECRWPRLVGLAFVCDLPCWGPDGATHKLFARVRPPEAGGR
ncbi:MAG TPA: hypothetical protein VGW34_09980 [Allosphingosinicella sp.]|nr:hypothetical protein [Allosphingosinicella sp.]